MPPEETFDEEGNPIEVVGAEEETAEPEPQPEDAGVWRGRLKKEQEAVALERQRVERVRSQLEAYGAQLDDDGNIIPPAQQQTQTEEMELDPNDLLTVADAERMVQRGVEKALQNLRPVFQQVNSLIDSDISRANEDWTEIKDDVNKELRQLGFQGGVAVAKAQAPDVLRLTIEAVRGRRALGQLASSTTESEAQRLKRLQSAGAVGGSGGTSPTGGTSQFTPEEQAQIKSMGMTEAEAAAMLDGPARIR
jgi:hypothetical protein